jgi:hypothetical protein
MIPVSVIGLFCEDIREEKSGQSTLIGILPDNLAIAQIPLVLPKLGIYLRVHFDAKIDIGPVKVRIAVPNGPTLEIGTIAQELVSQTRIDAQAKRLPYAGAILQGVMGSFFVPTAGAVQAFANIEGEDHLAAVINVVVGEAPPRPAT